MAEIIDSGLGAGKKVIRSGSAADVDNTITKNGAVYPLGGKTVTATIRAELKPNTVIDALLEDMVVTVGGGAIAALIGGVYFALSPTQSALLGPGAGVLADAVVDYVISYYVVSDNYKVSELLRFGVTRGLD